MSARDQERIIALRKCLKIAKDALTKLCHGDGTPYTAEQALEEIEQVETEKDLNNRG